MKTALLIEDQVLFSDLLTRVLKREAGIERIEVCRDGKTGLETALRLRPDLALVDLYLPGLSGMEVLRQMRLQAPECRVVMMTAFETPELVEEFRRSGAEGFVAKHAPFSNLLAVIQGVAAGKTNGEASFIGASAAAALKQKATASQTGLTPRELELLTYVAEGFSTKEIADKMGISFKTAQTHRANLMRKLDIHEVATLTRYAIHHGMVKPHLDGEFGVAHVN